MGFNMDKNIIKFIKTYNISDLEIADIITSAPMIEVLEYNEFIENCNLLVAYGYPKADLDVLLIANPNIFVNSPKKLEINLQDLKEEYGDIEEVLKNNPFII